MNDNLHTTIHFGFRTVTLESINGHLARLRQCSSTIVSANGQDAR